MFRTPAALLLGLALFVAHNSFALSNLHVAPAAHRRSQCRQQPPPARSPPEPVRRQPTSAPPPQARQPGPQITFNSVYVDEPLHRDDLR